MTSAPAGTGAAGAPSDVHFRVDDQGRYLFITLHLPLLGAELVVSRVVQDRNRITSGGITAGIDFGLRIAGQLRGEDYARTLELTLEYDPQPPFGSGTPEKAPRGIEKAARAMYEPLHAAAHDAAVAARKRWA